MTRLTDWGLAMTTDKTRSNHERSPEEPDSRVGQGWSGWDTRSMARSNLAPPVDAAVAAKILLESSEARSRARSTADDDPDDTQNSGE